MVAPTAYGEHVPRTDQTPKVWSRLGWSRLYLLATVGVAAACIAIRFYFAIWHPRMSDFYENMVTAEALVAGQGFLDASGQPSHHWPPLPALLQALPLLLFQDPRASVAFLMLITVASWATVAWTTADLYGWKAGALVFFVVSVSPWLIDHDSMMDVEPIVAGLYALLVWCLMKSTTNQRYLRGAGALAGVLYLLKASAGVMLIFAAACGLAWRLANGGRSKISREYVIGGAIAAFIALPWMLRNIVHFGLLGFSTQPGADRAVWHLMQTDPIGNLAQSIAYGIVMVLVLALPLVLAVAPSGFAIRTRERSSLLLVSFLVPLVTAATFISAFHLAEGHPYWHNAVQLRYLMPCLPVAAWLLFEHAKQVQTRVGYGIAWILLTTLPAAWYVMAQT